MIKIGYSQRFQLPDGRELSREEWVKELQLLGIDNADACIPHERNPGVGAGKQWRVGLEFDYQPERV